MIIFSIFPLDINECLSTIPLCQENAKCQNIPGSFICDCNLGFTEKGYNCSGTGDRLTYH